MSTSTTLTQTAQIVSIATALLGAGGIATLSLFDIPLLQSQPASRSLPLVRWLFSRGSHIFPTAAALSSASFAYLAYNALPSDDRTMSSILGQSGSGGQASFYAVASALTISIAPFTQFVMLPTNFGLIRKNEEHGGARSEKSAKAGSTGGRTAESSVEGKDDVNEFTDLSGPQEKTKTDSTGKDDDEVKQLLGKFGFQNNIRAILMGAGGLVGLITAVQG